MTSVIKEFLDREAEYHYKILEEIEGLENYGTDCNCDGEKYTYLFLGEWQEIINVCIECGGIK